MRMTKSHKYENMQTLKTLKTMVLSNPNNWWERLLPGWTAADIDERESLEEAAIVERLRRFCVLENSHTAPVSTGHAIAIFPNRESTRHDSLACKQRRNLRRFFFCFH